MKTKLKFFMCFVLGLVLLSPLFAIGGCTPLYENAICKIGKKSFSTLSEAIVQSQPGQTIEVFNDVKTDKSQLFVSKSAYGKDYVAYVIDKQLTIKGISQNYKKPKIYGSFQSSVDSISDVVAFENLEIINDYISLEDDSLNKPFKTAISVLEGSVTIKNCDLHKSVDVANETVKANNLSLLSGIEISRGKTLEGQKLVYDITGNKMSGYNNFSDSDSAFAFSLSANRGSGQNLNPFDLNGFEDSFMERFFAQNYFLSNATDFELSTQKGKFDCLVTNAQSMIKQEYFHKDSIVNFTGQVFGFDSVQDFEVYGQMKFVGVKNVNFIIKTSKGKVDRDVTLDQNVTVVVFQQMP